MYLLLFDTYLIVNQTIMFSKRLQKSLIKLKDRCKVFTHIYDVSIKLNVDLHSRIYLDTCQHCFPENSCSYFLYLSDLTTYVLLHRRLQDPNVNILAFSDDNSFNEY